ncbi:DUF488 family protein [Candidatus Bipolaricaulota bacterium]|nr:DUF488 family protein [Candidatus Bipolaricaulota bacterium]
MALRQTYLSMKAKLPLDVKAVLVMRGRGNDELAPSKKLLDDFNHYKRQFKSHSKWYRDAYRYAWDRSNYKQRFTEEILNNPKAMNHLKLLAEDAKHKDVYLICYEGEDKPCHRKLLLKIASQQFNAEVNEEAFQPEPDRQLSLL